MNRIKALRELKGVKQADLAKELNVSQGTLSNWERGVHDPDNASLVELAEYFEVSTDYLLELTDDPVNYEDPSLYDNISGAQWDYILEQNNYDEAEALKAYRAFKKAEQEDAMYDIAMHNFEDQIIRNPDIRLIARAGKKMTPEQAEIVRKYAQYMFPEAFDED